MKDLFLGATVTILHAVIVARMKNSDRLERLLDSGYKNDYFKYVLVNYLIYRSITIDKLCDAAIWVNGFRA